MNIKQISPFWILFLILSLLTATAVKAQFTVPCEYSPFTESVLSQVSQSSWAKWIRDISGENPVLIGGQSWEIFTRYSPALFNNNTRAYAYSYITQELENMGYDAGVTFFDHVYIPYNNYIWKNLVLNIPGHGENSDEIVMLTAHLDSTSTNPNYLAPGAEDNASGIATLMEAARLFRHYQFDRTIKIIFFTGEEQGLYGSEAYVEDHPDEMDDILGVVNLDMFGYDSDQDRCFEMHVGTMTSSNVIGSCFTEAIENYNLDLTYDYLTSEATGASDHASFWDAGVGAIEILENFFTNSQTSVCGEQDRNPHYHQTTDTIDKMYLEAAVDIGKGGIAAAMDLASPLGYCFQEIPTISTSAYADFIQIDWLPIENAESYLVFRSEDGCDGDWRLLGETSEVSYRDVNFNLGFEYAYQVEAADSPMACFSMPSACESIIPFSDYIYLPLITIGN